MGDKFDGTLAAGHMTFDSARCSIDTNSALQSLTLHETLVMKDENGDAVLLRAVQNPVAGGIMMVQENAHVHSSVMQEAIKRSQMTSMLADDARCSKYNEAIKRVLQERPGATVLDIGTGTGLLAMLTAKAGASQVTAVEMFEPLANYATEIIAANQLSETVSVVSSVSTDISIAGTNDNEAVVIKERADVLVTEIFDSALLGENCIRAIRHAHASLLKEGATVIPARARLYGTVISSDLFSRFRSFPLDFPLYKDDASKGCKGGSTGIPVHIDGLAEGADYECLSAPFEVFQFDFMKPKIPTYRQTSKRINRTKNGRPDALLTWWELDLTEKGDIVYSTKSGAENWQDHWLQVVYPLSGSENVSSIDPMIDMTMEHDDIGFSFAHGLGEEPSVLCQCGFHNIMTPYRIHEVGDLNTMEMLSSKLKEALGSLSTSNPDCDKAIRCLDISDNSICAVYASRIRGKRPLEIHSVEEDNEVSSFLFGRIAASERIGNNQVLVEYDPLSAFIEREVEKKESSDDWTGFDLIVSEPFTRAMHAYPIATLGNLMVQQTALSVIVQKNFTMVPSVGRILAQLVCFPQNTIDRSFKTIGNVQGLDLTPYSRLQEDGEWDQSQRRLSLPLFQYNIVLRSEKTCVTNVNFCAGDGGLHPSPSVTWIPVTSPGSVQAVALSVEYDSIPARRVSRSELIWLSEAEQHDLGRSGGTNISCEFLHETGVWDVRSESI